MGYKDIGTLSSRRKSDKPFTGSDRYDRLQPVCGILSPIKVILSVDQIQHQNNKITEHTGQAIGCQQSLCSR